MNAARFAQYKRTREQTGYSARDVLDIVRTRDAEHRGLIRFTWEYDQDADLSWADAETIGQWRAGYLGVRGCVAEVPKRCDHCGHEVGEDAWEVAASLWGIVVTGESDPYCRLVESELAHEAGVIE